MVIVWIIITVIFFLIIKGRDEEIKKLRLENQQQNRSLDLLSKSNSWTTSMRNNVDIVSIEGKPYAIVNIANVSRAFLGVSKISKYDRIALVYDQGTPLSVTIDPLARGKKMLIFPIPEGRKDGLSFKVCGYYKAGDFMGREFTAIDTDLFVGNRPMPGMIIIDRKAGTIMKVHVPRLRKLRKDIREFLANRKVDQAPTEQQA